MTRATTQWQARRPTLTRHHLSASYLGSLPSPLLRLWKVLLPWQAVNSVSRETDSYPSPRAPCPRLLSQLHPLTFICLSHLLTSPSRSFARCLLCERTILFLLLFLFPSLHPTEPLSLWLLSPLRNTTTTPERPVCRPRRDTNRLAPGLPVVVYLPIQHACL